MNDCCIGLGGNVGDVERTFDRALRRLEESFCHVIERSTVMRSAPMGDAAGSEFCNAVARVESDRDPASMLSLLQQIENELGRVRTTHWGPRTLDLDLLLFGDEVIDTDVLAVPHPGLWYRRFVLDPLFEIAADDRHPQFDLTIRELRGRTDVRPLIFEIVGAEFSERFTDDVVSRVLSDPGNRAVSTDVFARVQADASVPRGGIRRRHEDGFVVRCHPHDVEATVRSVTTAALGK